MKDTFAPIINIDLYFWNLYCKLWETLEFDTSSEGMRNSITSGIAFLLPFLFELLVLISEFLIDENKLRWYKI